MRGHESKVGDTRISPNGYHYTKVANRGDGTPGWRLTHHIKAEQYLGRPLASNERVHFRDKTAEGRMNFDKENLIIVTEGSSNVRRKITRIDAKIEDLRKERDFLLEQLSAEEKLQFQVSEL
jgi:hypothetical protein